MSKEVKFNTTIIEPDGTYYRALLTWVPRKGDLIRLHSFLEAKSGNPAFRFYEVEQVVHDLHDVTLEHPEGAQFLSIYVRRSNDRRLQQ